MKIFLIIMRHGYGDPARGDSYEYVNFYQTFLSMGHEVRIFDYMTEMDRLGREAMNAALLQDATAFGPDFALASLYTDQILPSTATALRTLCKTLCFFYDDTWRIEFSRFWAGHFDFFSSSDFEAKNKYQKLGLPNVIHIPFGVNEKICARHDLPVEYDVSFVGQKDPFRQWIVRKLERAGFRVKVAGFGWPGGSVSQDEMMRIFAVSKINLNLSNSTSWDARYLLSSPRALIGRLRSKKTVEQLKARHFEICASGGFQLSYFVDGLERCFRIGEEIGVYLSPDDLIDKVAYYLANDNLRLEMADAAYLRTLKEHTYQRRFALAFEQMGLNSAEFNRPHS